MLKPSDIARFLGGLVILAAIVGLVFLRIHPHRSPPAAPSAPSAPIQGREVCDGAAPAGAAAANTASLSTLAWSPFGRPETGWETYAPLIGREIGSRCGPGSAGFAAAYAAWQAKHRLAADGVFRAQEFKPMLAEIELRRPFVQQTSKGLCPAAPAESTLVTALPTEAYGAKAVQLRATTLNAYRKMVAAAKSQGLGQGENLLKLVSGFRGPAEEAARCSDGTCNTVTRAHCSAHRTGLAIDLFLDHAPGQDPTSTSDANRAAMARSPEYRWLMAHAAEFGFLPYPYEPWHWEWTGEPP